MQLGRTLFSLSLARVPRLPAPSPLPICPPHPQRDRSRSTFQQMDQIMEEVFYRACLPPWLRHALPKLCRLCVSVDEPPRGGVTRQGRTGSGVREKETPVFAAVDASFGCIGRRHVRSEIVGLA